VAHGTTTSCDHELEGFRVGYIWLGYKGSQWRMLCHLLQSEPIVADDQTTSYAGPLSSRNKEILYAICPNRHLTSCIGSVCLLGRLPANRDSRWNTAFHQRILRVNNTPPPRMGAESGQKAVKRNKVWIRDAMARNNIYSRGYSLHVSLELHEDVGFLVFLTPSIAYQKRKTAE
jgi:hypothetical protein